MNVETLIPYTEPTVDQLVRVDWGPEMVLARHDVFGFHATTWEGFHRDYAPAGYKVVLTTDQVRGHIGVDPDRLAVDGRRLALVRLLDQVRTAHPRRPGRGGYFDSWRCGCSQLAEEPTELHLTCPEHGAESLSRRWQRHEAVLNIPFPIAFGVVTSLSVR